jgi:cytochrome c-type biogenesis protein CcmE
MVMKRRHKRIAFIVLGLCGLGIAAALALSAFQENLVFFFSPSQVVAKEAPVGRTFRVGGLVEKGSINRDNDGLPDLFKEGRGCVAQGHIGTDGVFYADQVLAKHDENYMPPQAGQAIDAAKHEKEAAKTVVGP